MFFLLNTLNLAGVLLFAELVDYDTACATLGIELPKDDPNGTTYERQVGDRIYEVEVLADDPRPEDWDCGYIDDYPIGG